MADIPETPLTRKEQYLAAIAGVNASIPEKPLTREEQYLAYIAGNGGGGGVAGVSSFNGRTGAVNPRHGDYTAKDVGAIPEEEKSAPGGVATLDASGKLEGTQRPDSVTKFNGRVGVVIPKSDDYDKFYAYPLYTYDGVNIAEKFAGEMDFTPPWVWSQQRMAARDISGLHIKDYFEVEAGGNLLQMQLWDLNHDLGFTDTEITAFHADFGSKDLWPELHVWNKVNYNNGLSTEADPWLCSDLKAWLNSEEADVPNEAKASPQTTHVNYTTTGVYDKLPTALKNAIIERRSLEPSRFNASDLLTDDTTWAWKNIGKLWVPNETEVYSQVVWGTRNGYSVGETHQFPIFMDGKMRIKHFGTGGSRYRWWLRSARSGNSTYAAYVANYGDASGRTTSYIGIGAPVCFRISA